MSTIEDLLARVRENPEDASARLVLADAWIEEGDRRGDLVQVQHALTTAKGAQYTKLASQEELLIKFVRRRVLGEKLARSNAELRFTLGFIDELVIDTLDKFAPEVIAAVAKSESGIALRSLVIRSEDDRAIRDLLGKIEPMNVTHLDLVRYDEERTEDLYAEEPYDASDDLRRVPAVFPKIQELRIHLGISSLTLPELKSQTLRSFEWVSPYIDPEWIHPLARAQAPALERFVLDMAEAQNVETLDTRALQPILKMLDRCEKLHELTLRGVHGGRRFVQELLKHALLGRVRSLDLSGVSLDEDLVDEFVAALDKFASPLERLTMSVSASARITERGIKIIEPKRLKKFVFERYDDVQE